MNWSNIDPRFACAREAPLWEGKFFKLGLNKTKNKETTQRLSRASGGLMAVGNSFPKIRPYTNTP